LSFLAIPEVEPVVEGFMAAQVLTLPLLPFACLSLLADNEEDLTLLDCSDPTKELENIEGINPKVLHD